jgi:hypothetical protein
MRVLSLLLTDDVIAPTLVQAGLPVLPDLLWQQATEQIVLVLIFASLAGPLITPLVRRVLKILRPIMLFVGSRMITVTVEEALRKILRWVGSVL